MGSRSPPLWRECCSLCVIWSDMILFFRLIVLSLQNDCLSNDKFAVRMKSSHGLFSPLPNESGLGRKPCVLCLMVRTERYTKRYISTIKQQTRDKVCLPSTDHPQ